MDLTKYEEIFRRESLGYLAELDALLPAVYQSPSDTGVWGEIHGKIHSIKGMSRALSLERISGLCHHVESWCKAFQDGAAETPPAALNLMEEAVDLLRLLIEGSGEADSDQTRSWYDQLTERLAPGPSADAGRTEGVRAPPAAVQAQPIDHVRVPYGIIEQLLGLSQEIQTLEKTIPPEVEEETLSAVKSWIHQSLALMKTFYFRLSLLRLLTVEEFMALFTHTVHRLARDAEKTVELEIAGGDIQADITLLERLREPLMHVLRNCIAHGIEPPAERQAAGKPAAGTIRVAAAARKERLQLTVSDDGRGIDPAPIRRFLAAKRGMAPENIARLTEADLFRTILAPDYSSMDQTTDIAGRGVGMNVVAQTVTQLGGTLDIQSEAGAGTTIDISMPLSLSVIYAVTFRVDRYVLSIPTSEVAGIRRAADADAPEIERAVNFRRHLKLSESAGEFFFQLIDLKTDDGEFTGADGGSPAAILADAIVGNRPLMIIPISEPLSRVGLYAGVGIMENGDVTMVLDRRQLGRLM